MKKLFISLCSIALASCVSMQSTTDEVKNLAPGEGVVVGSILVSSDATLRNTPSWFGRQKASDVNYNFSFAKLLSFEVYDLDVKHGKEEFFVRTLPAGKYTFRPIKFKTSTFSPDLMARYQERFTVEAGKTTYIGKFHIVLPLEINGPSDFLSKRLNELESARAAIAKTYPEVAQKLVNSYQ